MRLSWLGLLALLVVACGQPVPTPRAPATRGMDFSAPRVIYYLAPLGNVRGGLNEISALANGWTRVVSWDDLHNAARARPPDAIVVDKTLMAQATPADLRWLRAQFDNGVIVGSFGADFDQLAHALNTKSIRDGNEGALSDPALFYILVYEYVQASPKDFARVARHYPDATFTRDPHPVEGQAGASSGRFIGHLDDPLEFRALFQQLNITIDSIRQQRAEFDLSKGITPLYEITTDDPQNQVSYMVQDGVAHFDIFSERGIGRAQIKIASPLAPREIVLRLHLKGLESLKFSYDTNEIQVAVSSHGDPAVTETARVNGARHETQLSSGSELWMPTEIVSTLKAIPLQDGFFRIALPRAFQASAAREFSIEWIDFYR